MENGIITPGDAYQKKDLNMMAGLLFVISIFNLGN